MTKYLAAFMRGRFRKRRRKWIGREKKTHWTAGFPGVEEKLEKNRRIIRQIFSNTLVRNRSKEGLDAPSLRKFLSRLGG